MPPNSRWSQMPDSHLVQLILAGDVGEPWEELFRRHLEAARGVAFRVVRREWPESTDMAEDIALESLSKAHFHLDRYRPSLPFSAWLRTIVVNTARDRLRRECGSDYSRRVFRPGRLDEIARSDQTPLGRLTDREDREAARRQVEAAVQSLPPPQRELLLARFVRREPVPDIARGLGLAEQTVRGGLTRAKQALLRRLRLPADLPNRELEELLHATLRKPTRSRDDPPGPRRRP
jgi:RNA polymerase sigma-70 factor (ECF subfamily)